MKLFWLVAPTDTAERLIFELVIMAVSLSGEINTLAQSKSLIQIGTLGEGFAIPHVLIQIRGPHDCYLPK